MHRKKFIEHVSWTGLGIVWAIGSNGLFTACKVGEQNSSPTSSKASPLSFVQISDTHIGFKKPANEHVTDTLQKTIAAINALAVPPAFVVHTGDITHLSKPEEFDLAKQLMSQLKVPLFTLAGEHDTIGDRGTTYAEAFKQQDVKEGLQIWDRSGIHFLAVTNVLDFAASGKGVLGQAQLDLLAKDLAAQKQDTPIVIFSHLPLYDIYPQWGWATADSAKLLSLLSRFDSVTVLSGHIHQVVRHQEGNIQFHTAASTAFPLPAPGNGEHPTPVKLPETSLLKAIGFHSIDLIPSKDPKIDRRALR
jgi:3',5'-cyclic-AMP phosphodiesterase